MRTQVQAAPHRRRPPTSMADANGVPTRSASRTLCAMVEAARRGLTWGFTVTFAPGAGLPILLGAAAGYRLGSAVLGAVFGLLALPLLAGIASALWGAFRHEPDNGEVTQRQIQHGLRMLSLASMPALERLRLARDLVALAERVYEPVRPILDALMQHPEGLERAAEAMMDELPQELNLKGVATMAVLARIGQRNPSVGRRVRPMALALAVGQPDPFCFSRCLQELRRCCLDNRNQPIPLALEALR